MVELEGVSHSYPVKRKGEIAALRQVNALFKEGTFSAIIGPSGCGKTSLIKIMAGLIVPGAGTVTVGTSPLKGVRRQTAVIFQDYGLLPWKTVRANAELPLRIHHHGGGQRVDALLEEFGLAAFAGLYPHQLSGGMKQRLAIVRALVVEPELLLMDEPFSSLDAISREDAQDFLLSVQRNRPVQQGRRLTVIMVTHSIEEAVYLADSVYVMNGVNPGTITERITICREDDLPGPLPHARFRGEMRFQEYCGVIRRACRPVKETASIQAGRSGANP